MCVSHNAKTEINDEIASRSLVPLHQEHRHRYPQDFRPHSSGAAETDTRPDRRRIGRRADNGAAEGSLRGVGAIEQLFSLTRVTAIARTAPTYARGTSDGWPVPVLLILAVVETVRGKGSPT